MTTVERLLTIQQFFLKINLGLIVDADVVVDLGDCETWSVYFYLLI